MDHIRRIQKFEQFKILGDARRLVILKILMSGPQTLSSLGKILGEHPARVRHHLKQLEKAGFVELVSTRSVRGFVEKYYQAKARAFVYQGVILPATPDPDQEIIAVLGSHDLALELLAQRFNQDANGAIILPLPVGSMDGLIALRQGNTQIAGCHLLDPESGEYNLPYIRHFFPDRSVILFTLAYREQGILIAPGNPHQIHGLEDLARENVTMINRNQGSGTRLWLDSKLKQLRLPSQEIRGYHLEALTHTAVANAVAQGQAMTGIGLRAAARRFNLDFIPLFQERYDLVVFQDQTQDPRLIPLFDYLQSGTFRREIRRLGGYDTTHTGEQLLP